MNDVSDWYPQNDPDRARGLITDAQGEFVQQHPGGAFDPRTFRRTSRAGGRGPAGQARPEGERGPSGSPASVHRE
ncbi:hypothetical protein [Actinoplanes utahensis]|uniref:Uncharacterized protein n=1 Tax=Actinoplanes utahensis TaxID=1869 RepID=A0A0A6X4W4_ACTUT|nr:hypothetical protein [Actinoplanes utahensis]KHD75152.1 hypothetical protein MB27_24880 [Actinoplanes utahensis]GIF27106.1 hypothetical protein Aut01nite_00920 [Actinoplanes utahensis]